MSTKVYNVIMKQIEFYTHTNGKKPVIEWLKSLDKVFAGRIAGRFARIIKSDNFGDFKKINENISELRFKFGKGYRIYYTEANNTIVLLLCAGDKKLQSKDIETAKEYYEI